MKNVPNLQVGWPAPAPATPTTLTIRGIQTLDFSRKTTNAVLSDQQVVDVVK